MHHWDTHYQFSIKTLLSNGHRSLVVRETGLLGLVIVGTCWDLLGLVGTCWDLLGLVGTC